VSFDGSLASNRSDRDMPNIRRHHMLPLSHTARMFANRFTYFPTGAGCLRLSRAIAFVRRNVKIRTNAD